VLSSGASETVPDRSEFGRQLLNLLERNTEPLLDPVSMYDRIRLGVTQTEPLLGSLPGNEQGASFVLFLRSSAIENAPTTATSTPPTTPTLTITRSYGSLVVSVATAGTLYLDGKPIGDLPAGANARLDSVDVGDRSLELRYADGQVEDMTANVEEGQSSGVSFTYNKNAPAIVVTLAQVSFLHAPGGNWAQSHKDIIINYRRFRYSGVLVNYHHQRWWLEGPWPLKEAIFP